MKINGRVYVEGRKWEIKGVLWTMLVPINGKFKVILDCGGKKEEFSNEQAVEKFVRKAVA